VRDSLRRRVDRSSPTSPTDGAVIRIELDDEDEDNDD
jgi:hypothetical protein